MSRAQVDEQTSLGLSAREIEVMSLIAGGHTNGEIAAPSMASTGTDTRTTRLPKVREDGRPG